MAGTRWIVMGKHLSKGEVMGLASKVNTFGDERDRERNCECLRGLGLKNWEEVAEG